MKFGWNTARWRCWFHVSRCSGISSGIITITMKVTMKNKEKRRKNRGKGQNRSTGAVMLRCCAYLRAHVHFDDLPEARVPISKVDDVLPLSSVIKGNFRTDELHLCLAD